MDYDAIPYTLKRFMTISRDDYNRSPRSMREFALRFAEQMYLEDVIRRDRNNIQHIPHTFNFDGWVWTDQTVSRLFGRYMLEEYRYIGQCNNQPIILDAENAYDFVMHIDNMMVEHHPDDSWRCYQVTLVTNHGYLNALPLKLTNCIMKRLEIYEEKTLEIYQVLGRYLSHQRQQRVTRRLIQNVSAGNGEGISIYLNDGFWLLDVARSRTLCILNCFIAWQYYKKKTLFHLKTCLKEDQKALSLNVKRLSIHQLNENYPHHFNVLFNEDELSGIRPIDTIHQCHYYYRNGHMYLLVHESLMDSTTRQTIEDQSRTMTLGKIRMKKAITMMKDFCVMDIESYREQQSDGSFIHIPLIVGHIDNDQYNVIKGEYCLEKYFSFLRSKQKEMIIWAHNGGGYDFHIMMNAAIKYCDKGRDHPIELLDIDGRYIEMCLVKKDS
ncbi:hypothetical protein G6F27_012813 [Rhizopus arrhizus]|nr:hypothetical protein G6F27_012813 [Rhizopus arrhizus]